MGIAVEDPPARQLGRLVDRAEVRVLSRPRNGPGLVLLAAHLAALGLGGAWVWAARGTWWVVPALVVHGAVVAHLFALLHEASHGTAFRSRWLCSAAAHGAGFALGLPAGYFRLEHLAHHQATQDPERDPELIAVPASRRAYATFVAGLPYWWWATQTFATHVAGRTLGFEHRFLAPRARPAVVREARAYLAGYIVVVGVAAATGALGAVVWLWLLPRLVGEPWMRVARLSEHAGRPLTSDITENTRSLAGVPRPLRLLAWNMPYHAEHHAAPGVPFHALPRLHARLAPHLQGRAEGGYRAAQGEILAQVGRHQVRHQVRHGG